MENGVGAALQILSMVGLDPTNPAKLTPLAETASQAYIALNLSSLANFESGFRSPGPAFFIALE